MKKLADLFLTRHEPERGLAEHFKSAIGATLGLLLVGGIAAVMDMPLMTAPLGATAVLLFGYPGSALTQPVNVFGAYLIGTIVGVLAARFLPHEWWVIAPAIGLCLFLMQTLRITHPPAGAIPVLTLTTPGDNHTLFFTLLLTCLVLLGFALLFHRVPPRRVFPAPHPGLPVQDHSEH